MSIIKRVFASHNLTLAFPVIIDIDGVEVKIPKGIIVAAQTPANIMAYFEAQVSHPVDDVFFHINDDGSVAVATGTEPDVWPEDE